MVDGPPELDLAEFAVDLSMRALLPAAEEQAFVDCLLGEYERYAGRSIDTALLRIFADAEFVNRCYRHLRRRSPGWEADLTQQLDGHARIASMLPA